MAHRGMIEHEAYHTLEVWDEITGTFMQAYGAYGEYEPASVEVAHEIARTKFPEQAYRIVSTITVYPEGDYRA